MCLDVITQLAKVIIQLADPEYSFRDNLTLEQRIINLQEALAAEGQ